MDADAAKRMNQLTAVTAWLEEIQAAVLGDIEIAVEEGAMDDLQRFTLELSVVRNLHGTAKLELTDMRKHESRIAQQRLEEWVLATQRKNEVQP